MAEPNRGNCGKLPPFSPYLFNKNFICKMFSISANSIELLFFFFFGYTDILQSEIYRNSSLIILLRRSLNFYSHIILGISVLPRIMGRILPLPNLLGGLGLEPMHSRFQCMGFANGLAAGLELNIKK